MRLSRGGRWLLIGLVLLAALGIRVAQVERSSYHAINDAGTYNRFASGITQTGDYVNPHKPGSGAGGSRGPTAYFPPGFPYFLAAVDLIDGHGSGGKAAVPSERIAQTLLGTVSVGLLALVALEAFGPQVGWTTLVLASVYPVLIEDSTLLLAENLMLALELGAVWAALRARRAAGRRAYAWIAASGVLTGLASLTHENGLLLLIPLGIAAWREVGVRRPSGRDAPGTAPEDPRPSSRLRALGAPALLLATSALMIAPWTIRNAAELHTFIPVSDETGITLVGTYNPVSAAYPLPWKWHFFWKLPQDAQLRLDAPLMSEPQLGSRLLGQAEHYISQHPLAPLSVAFHNTLRLLELEGSYAWHASAAAVSLNARTARVGVVAFWIVTLLALLGAFSLAARRAPLWLWGVPILLGLSVVFVNVETPRFREPVDPFLVLLAACAVATALRRLGDLQLRRAPVRRRRGAPRVANDTQLVKMVKRLS